MSIKVERAFTHKVPYAVSVYTIIHWSYRWGGGSKWHISW